MTMPFTDKDVERLKKFDFPDCHCLDGHTHIPKIDALLARLEAAENVCKAAESLVEEIETGHMDWRVVKVYVEEWRKARGIDPESLAEWDRKSKGE